MDGFMKTGLLLLFIVLSWPAAAQQSIPERKGSIHFSDEPLEAVLASLKEIYSVEFSYSDDVIPLMAPMSLSATDVSLQWVLERLAEEFQITYKVLRQRIILSRKQVPLRQTVRGMVKDHATHLPIPGASIVITGTSPLIGAISDGEGYFRIDKVPVGRWDIKISCIGYSPRVLKDLVLHTGKELVLEALLQESFTQMEELRVLANGGDFPSKNASTAVSARSFTVEESKRYAGSVGDPARMAANFAGVTGTNDETNALVIRGNSPRALLWRIEGIEVPNPNHFTSEGASGGVVSVLSPNVIGDAEFYTGAFSAEYGNALSGVFDIALRNGNNERREHSFQLGVLGAEASTEGPISKKNASSYLVNYRYSSLSLLNKAGVDLNRANEYKNYQDIAFKINVPNTAAGSFSLFGIGGLSRAVLDEHNSQLDNNYADVGIAGLNHQKLIKENLLIRSALSFSGTHILKQNEALGLESGFLALEEDYYKTYARASLRATKKFSGNYLLEAGAIYSRLQYNFFLRNRDSENDAYQEVINFNEKGGTRISQAFISSRQTFSPALQADYGFHLLHFGLTNDLSLEPRLGLRWKLSSSQAVNMGYGKHSRIENLQYYLARDHQKGGNEIQINRDLGFTRANHFVLGYEKFLQPQLHFKAESYYQQLFNAPVGLDPSRMYSAINEDTGFITDTLINAGSGRNYGVELSLEKSFFSNFYYLLNGTLYQSKFDIGEGWEKSSAYNGNYNFNALAGYETKLMQMENKQMIGFNIGGTYAGGTPYIPIDLEKSREAGTRVYDMEKAFEFKLPDYFRADLQLVYKNNKPGHSIEWRLDIRNVTNRRNAAFYAYDAEQKTVQLRKQRGLLPILAYRVEF